MWKYEAGVLQPGGLIVDLHVRQDQDVRVVRVVEFVDHVRLRWPDAARERGELRRRQGLGAYAEHLMLVEHALELAELGIVELRQVGAVHLGAEAIAERSCVEHGFAGGIVAPGRLDEYWGLTGRKNVDMKLITWNTQSCCGLDGTVSPQRIVEGARAMADFDVLCLQEIAQGFDRLQGAPIDQPAQLAALLPGYRCFFGAAVDEFLPDGRRQRFGNFVATRLPVARVQHHALPWPADDGVRSMPRMCTAVTVLSPLLGAVRVMTTHLEYYSAPQRLAQARALRALHDEACIMAAAPPEPSDDGSPFQTKVHTPHAVLCGDFNAAASDAAIAALCAPGGGRQARTPSRTPGRWPEAASRMRRRFASSIAPTGRTRWPATSSS